MEKKAAEQESDDVLGVAVGPIRSDSVLYFRDHTALEDHACKGLHHPQRAGHHALTSIRESLAVASLIWRSKAAERGSALLMCHIPAETPPTFLTPARRCHALSRSDVLCFVQLPLYMLTTLRSTAYRTLSSNYNHRSSSVSHIQPTFSRPLSTSTSLNMSTPYSVVSTESKSLFQLTRPN